MIGEALAGIDASRIDNSKADFEYYGSMFNADTSNALNSHATRESTKLFFDELEMLPEEVDPLASGTLNLEMMSDDLTIDQYNMAQRVIANGFKNKLDSLAGAGRKQELNNLLGGELVSTYFPNKEDRQELKDDAYFAWAMRDANDLESAYAVRDSLKNSKDNTYDLSQKEANRTLANVNQTIKRFEKEEKIATGSAEVNSQSQADEIIANQTFSYGQQYYAIKNLRMKPANEQAKIAVLDSSRKIMASTNNDVQAKIAVDISIVNKAFGNIKTDYDTDDIEKYINATQKIIESIDKNYADGKLSFGSYQKLLKDTNDKFATKMAVSAGEMRGEDEYSNPFAIDWEYDDAWKEFNREFNNEQTANNLFGEYFVKLGELSSKNQDSNDQRKALSEQIVKDHREHLRNVASDMATQYMGRPRSAKPTVGYGQEYLLSRQSKKKLENPVADDKTGGHEAGKVYNGYEFLGGDYKDQKNWKEVK
jgi:hypothetical protein